MTRNDIVNELGKTAQLQFKVNELIDDLVYGRFNFELTSEEKFRHDCLKKLHKEYESKYWELVKQLQEFDNNFKEVINLIKGK